MASIDIEIDDILYSLSGYEKQELADELYDDGYVAKQVKQVIDEDLDDWDTTILKLKGNKWKLTKEDEETILRITNKLI
jgi:hypothetical protein